MATTGSTSRLFVRNSTGLVRTASALDATIFNAVISAPGDFDVYISQDAIKARPSHGGG